MLIEYKIKFEQDGVTITQRFEPDASDSALTAPTPDNGVLIGRSLGPVFEQRKGKPRPQGGENPTGPGGGGEDPTGPGGGGEDPTGPGGNGRGARPIIILGPIVVGAPSRIQASRPVEPRKEPVPEKTVHRRAAE